MATMVAMDFVFMVCWLVEFRESLAGNGNELDLFARIRNPQRGAGGGVTPLQCFVRLIAHAAHWLDRATGKVQALVPCVVNNLGEPGGHKSVIDRAGAGLVTRRWSKRRDCRDLFRLTIDLDARDDQQHRGRGQPEAERDPVDSEVIGTNNVIGRFIFIRNIDKRTLNPRKKLR